MREYSGPRTQSETGDHVSLPMSPGFQTRNTRVYRQKLKRVYRRILMPVLQNIRRHQSCHRSHLTPREALIGTAFEPLIGIRRVARSYTTKDSFQPSDRKATECARVDRIPGCSSETRFTTFPCRIRQDQS